MTFNIEYNTNCGTNYNLLLKHIVEVLELICNKEYGYYDLKNYPDIGKIIYKVEILDEYIDVYLQNDDFHYRINLFPNKTSSRLKKVNKIECCIDNMLDKSYINLSIKNKLLSRSIYNIIDINSMYCYDTILDIVNNKIIKKVDCFCCYDDIHGDPDDDDFYLDCYCTEHQVEKPYKFNIPRTYITENNITLLYCHLKKLPF
uniref:Uncharacterized protein n=1 Tax=Pithovirus LCDPAC02 TaxID=2506601 RepID=A0A481YRN4_9VIRU|nr:MAG: hypothetical protein LCDPAC02_03250 [Pithovirus LCDPAC02]